MRWINYAKEEDEDEENNTGEVKWAEWVKSGSRHIAMTIGQHMIVSRAKNCIVVGRRMLIGEKRARMEHWRHLHAGVQSGCILEVKCSGLMSFRGAGVGSAAKMGPRLQASGVHFRG